ncbi:hypothetical protein PMAYCL1PPCAC_17776 [Pristionchus mayeri]|uniref:Uncharacterized protein n=1 Tax=Pristionchus mayeri TaxID=1317129 RepID=A0AAN5I1E6_9BILA|nr:hypothetical protein PMAYCL1PPCAC_17776 [Pristionchus mayeri]
MSLHRPRNDETEEDLLRMQEEFLKGSNEKRAATAIRVVKKTAEIVGEEAKGTEYEESPSKQPMEGSRFTLDLDQPSIAVPDVAVLGGVQERNVSFVENASSMEELEGMANEAVEDYSKDDGFPDVLDLSSYYSAEGETRSTPPGHSFFAAEFDRLHGRISEGDMEMKSGSGGKEEEKESSSGDDFSEENDQRIASMNTEEIERARREIEEKLDPKLLSWLRDKHKRRAVPSSAESGESDKELARPPKKMSRFKRERMETAASSSSSTQSTTSPIPEEEKEESTDATPSASSSNLKPVDEMMGNLEILEEYGNREDQEKYDRLAIDAVRMEFASRSMRFLLPRQQANAIKLFDIVKQKKSSSPSDSLLDEARNRMEEIKTLYLEVIEPEGGQSHVRFAAGSSPLTDSCWMLVPLRRVLDHIQSSSSSDPSPSHIDTIRLSLLWSLLLFVDRPSAWGTYTEVAEVYVRLAECFLMGPAVYKDEVISACLSRLFSSYLLPSALNGLLTIRTTVRIAGLDAFAPFWDELLRSYESHSSGWPAFSSFLLLPSYLNGSLSDGIQLRLALWSPQRNVVRQMTVKGNEDERMISLLAGAKSRSEESVHEMEDALFVPYAQQLGCYLAALRDDVVMRGRNEALFELASNELGRFVQRHTEGTERNPDPNRAKEFDVLVDIIRKTMASKISF